MLHKFKAYFLIIFNFQHWTFRQTHWSEKKNYLKWFSLTKLKVAHPSKWLLHRDYLFRLKPLTLLHYLWPWFYIQSDILHVKKIIITITFCNSLQVELCIGTISLTLLTFHDDYLHRSVNFKVWIWSDIPKQ